MNTKTADAPANQWPGRLCISQGACEPSYAAGAHTSRSRRRAPGGGPTRGSQMPSSGIGPAVRPVLDGYALGGQGPTANPDQHIATKLRSVSTAMRRRTVVMMKICCIVAICELLFSVVTRTDTTPVPEPGRGTYNPSAGPSTPPAAVLGPRRAWIPRDMMHEYHIRSQHR